MNEPGSPEAREYATLFLARAILEGSLDMARAALDAGADPDAFWIDGETTLRDLAAFRDRKQIRAHFDRLPRDSASALPTYRPLLDRSRLNIWSREFVLFAVARGYGFATLGDPLPIPSGLDGGRRARNIAAKVIDGRWSSVSRVAVEDSGRDDDHARSAWIVDFLPADNFPFGGRSPTRLTFWVDEGGWALFKKFDENKRRERVAKAAGQPSRR